MKALYPADWKRIRAEILARAHNRCEKCGRQNLTAHIVSPSGYWCVYSVDGARDIWHDENGRIVDRPVDDTLSHLTRTILTVSHQDHDPTNNAPSNLKALCQRCHLVHDAKEHASNARRTRARKAGQCELKGVEG